MEQKWEEGKIEFHGDESTQIEELRQQNKDLQKKLIEMATDRNCWLTNAKNFEKARVKAEEAFRLYKAQTEHRGKPWLYEDPEWN